MNYKHHYVVNYNSEQYEERTSIISRTHPYESIEEFVEEIEERDNDSSIQVEEFEEVSGIVAFILNLF
ncbi:MAG: hypothetical protein KME29_15735 [Calothrix sp. FI2-JRJ7]|jgi:hypothetical protein|nr:hypothetical protein [Calothrix sp. FI2-JRJ7]